MSRMLPKALCKLRRLFQVLPGWSPCATQAPWVPVCCKAARFARSEHSSAGGLGRTSAPNLSSVGCGVVESGCSPLAPFGDPSASFPHPPAGGPAEHCTGDSSPNPFSSSEHEHPEQNRVTRPEPSHDPVFCSSSVDPRPKECEARPQPPEVSAAPAPEGPRPRKPLPGTRATPVTASELWAEWFGALSASDCGLSVFFHSLRELPGKAGGPLQTLRAATTVGLGLCPCPTLSC